MKKIFLYLLIILSWRSNAQVILLNNTYGAVAISDIVHDTLKNRNYYSYCVANCGFWGTTNTTCKLFPPSGGQIVAGVVSQYNSLINKYSYSDHTLTTQLQNATIGLGPSQAVSSFSASYAQKTVKEGSQIYTNLVYLFQRLDTTTLSTVWSYSINTGAREISTFEHRNDSIFLFEKDSSSTVNYYTLSIRSKLTGNAIPYTSLSAGNIANPKGAIVGKITASYLIGNRIVVCGTFVAYSGGLQIGFNVASIDIPSGQLSSPGLTFNTGGGVYDMTYLRNTFYLAGKFSSINSNVRHNLFVLDQNLNLLPDTIHFRGVGTPTNPNVFVDDVSFHDNVLYAKGNFNSINSVSIAPTNTYTAKAFNTTLKTLLPYNFSLPVAPVTAEKAWLFKVVRNKLYINRFQGSGFHIFCLPPPQTAPTIVHSNSGVSLNSQSVCVPNSSVSATSFTAPFSNATNYTWNYTGTGVTLLPVGNGSVVNFVGSAAASSGTLTVYATNECGSNTPTLAVDVVVKLKPIFITPSSPQLLLCQPDSTQLIGASLNPSVNLFWRKQTSTVYSVQPVFVKTTGTYFLIAQDAANGCSDSSSIQVNTYYNTPNAKLLSHAYLGPLIPVDSVTCSQPTVILNGGSDSSGVNVTWRNLLNTTISTNPSTLSAQANLKMIVTKTANGCADSSLIVYVAQYKPVINFNLSAPVYTINCSYNTTTLQAFTTQTNTGISWSGGGLFDLPNPLVVSTAGNYTVTSTEPISGCQKTETVNVTAYNDIVLKSSNDTLVCKNSVITISTAVIGSVSSVAYNWSNSATTANNTITAINTSTYIVRVIGAGGCIGRDTIVVRVAPTIRDSVVATKNCANVSAGNIIVFANAGLSPFMYSINNGASFSASNSFTNVAFGTYSTVVKDALGCTKTNTVVLDAFVGLPTPRFMASTINMKGDTIVLVDISVPKPDSVQWLLPPNVRRIGGTMFSPVVLSSDTGSFNITMRGFYGACIVPTTKAIRFGAVDSLVATNYNANGIQSVSLYPNPNDGQFTATISFYKKQNASVQVWSSNGSQVQQNFYSDVKAIRFLGNLSNLPNGAYMLRVIGEYDMRNVPFVIQK
jgi:hypothetical protein